MYLGGALGEPHVRGAEGGAGPSPGTGSDLQHISLGPIPALLVTLPPEVCPGRFGGGRRGGCLGTLGKPEDLQVTGQVLGVISPMGVFGSLVAR